MNDTLTERVARAICYAMEPLRSCDCVGECQARKIIDEDVRMDMARAAIAVMDAEMQRPDYVVDITGYSRNPSTRAVEVVTVCDCETKTPGVRFVPEAELVAADRLLDEADRNWTFGAPPTQEWHAKLTTWRARIDAAIKGDENAN